MISRGRYNHLHLYEVTEQDLLIPTETAAQYTAGNVLIFADKKSVDLGHEIARADDIATAREYLENTETLLYERIEQLQAQNSSLSKRIEQRDELLRDVSEALRHERDMKALLDTELGELRAQLEIEALSRNELVDDLQQVSADTQTVEAALEKTIVEKANLEQELATHIANLIELNFQNDDLKRQLEEPATSSAILENSKHQTLHETPHQEIHKVRDEQESRRDLESGQVLTVPSGKQIHVYHEFAAPPKRIARTTASLLTRSILRILAALFIVAILFVALSVFATAHINDVSMGKALDLLFGFF